jgi:small subunit ribosomal protein S13
MANFFYFADRKHRATATLRTVLLSIFGLGEGAVNHLAAKIGLPPSIRFRRIPSSKLRRLQSLLSTLPTGRALRKRYILRVSEKERLGTYQGVRHLQGLPTRGQRTHSNGRTASRVRFRLQ